MDAFVWGVVGSVAGVVGAVATVLALVQSRRKAQLTPAGQGEGPQAQGGQGVQPGVGSQFIQIYIEHKAQPAVSAGGLVAVGEVPRRSAVFQPRGELAARLSGSGPGVVVVRAVTGMRGVGKTQLVAEYARSCIDAGWRLVAWINATDTATALSGLAEIAGALGIGESAADLERVGMAVRHRLEGDGERCLVVFDNAADLDGLARFLPAAGQCQVIITSNQVPAGQLGAPVTVGVFTEAEALAFLTGSTGRTDDEAGARELAAEVGFLPLALAQAAAVIADQHLDYPTYLARLRATPVQDYLTRSAVEPYPHGVAEAIVLALDAAASDDRTGLCRGLVNVVAVLAEAGVSRQLLYAAGQQGLLQPGAGTEQVDTALGRLASSSLLTFSMDDSTVAAHRLTMRVARERQVRDGTLARLGAGLAGLLEEVAAALPEPWQNRVAARDAIQQVMALHEHLASFPEVGEPGLAEALLGLRGWAVWCLNQLGDRFGQAIDYDQALVADCERVLGDTHPDTLTARSYLAYAYQVAGRADEAIPLFERILTDRERVLGDTHPDTLTARNNLAGAYGDAGRVDEAIQMKERTLADFERVLGDAHPDTLTARNGLALAYRAAWRADEAIPLYERTLADFERLLGDTHPSTLTARNNLAGAYWAAGRVDEAISLWERTLADAERVLGDTHHLTPGSRGNLAAAYQMAGRAAEAIPLHERTLADFERVLGDTHPDTLTARNNLAGAYEDAGRAAEAIPLYERTLADRERVLGDTHPDTLGSRNDLASAYRDTGRAAEAIPLYERTLADRERVLGDTHPSTLTSCNGLASAYRDAGRAAEAIPLFERTLADRERVLGDTHPLTLGSRNDLASAHRDAGRLAEAIPLYERTLADRERVLGDTHPLTVGSRNDLALAYQASGRLDEAEALQERAEPES